MKKNLFFIVGILLLMLLMGCSTAIDISYMRSANVDMGHYKNIAVASAVPYNKGYMPTSAYMRYYDLDSSMYPVYSSYSRNLPYDVASYATDAVVSALSQNGYFKVMGPAETDAIITLSKAGINSSAKFSDAGIDAVIIPSIEYMNVDEYSRVYIDYYNEKYDPRTGIKTREPHYTYAYYQKVSLTLSLTVIDPKTERIIAKRVYRKEDPSYKEYTYTPYGYGFALSDVHNPYSTFKTQLNSFRKSIIRDFIPTRVYSTVELLGNKPKIKSLKAAYDAAEDGNLSLAYNAFIDEWNRSGHIPSAYNAAVIQAARGDLPGAIEFLEGVRRDIQNSDINSLYNMMVAYKAEDDKAKAQMSAESQSDTVPADIGSLYSIYTALGK